MRRFLFLLIVSGIGLSTVFDASAQDVESAMLDGQLAFRDQRFDDAVAAFESVLQVDSENALAHFLLARIFFETPLKDDGRAGDEIRAALKIEPDNVQYLTAQLQQNDTPSFSYFKRFDKEIRRRELAFKIIRLDSTNAFANHELGKSYIRDFWRYRNAMVFPSLLFARDENLRRQTIDPAAGLLDRQVAEIEGITDDQIQADQDEQWALQAPGFLNANAIMMSDQFDVETLKAQGMNVQDLTGRATRAYATALKYLTTALESDPRKRGVYTDLMKIYSLKGEFVDALSMLQQMYIFFPEDPELWTFLGLAQLRIGDLQASSKVFETAFEYMDEDEEYAYTHLKDILPEEEQRLYEADEAAYAARFWTSKDPRYLTPFNERKLEHYARLTYADLLYGIPDLNVRGWNTERGRILVRYGVPNADVVVIPRSTSGVQEGLNPITGTYGDPQASTSAALKVGLEGSGWDMAEEANTYNIWDYGAFKFVFEDPFRNGEFRLFSPSAYDIADGVLPWANDYEIKARETFRKTPETYEFEPPGRKIDLPFLVSSFKSFSSDMTDVYVNYGVPVTDYDPDEDMINVTANAGTFVVGENRDMLVERRRTIYGLQTSQVAQFEESNLWIDTEELRVPAGSHEVSVEFETTGGGTVAVQRRAAEILDFTGDDLALSDILLAYRVDEMDDGNPILPTDILRSGLSIMPAPWSVFSHEQPIYLYFEVYNLDLPSGGVADYEVEAILAPKEQGSTVGRFVKGLFGGGDKGVSVTLGYQVASRNDGQYLILDAANQETGLYTLVLRVKDLTTGRELRRQQDLFLE